ncbi:PREDICTED: uncharacterized protein LOC106337817 [Brassica oleracea var. oleracea]|uniref:uncharacterized protein LOC106337817 n=1 Tax=Brassica oleracea var. oleracea TaxID=109376 RepID=UPI0006A7083D|nr:PREDICTED: uncharacterized protein LOC106337817 [Brassica oleracea var. oleracea]
MSSSSSDELKERLDEVFDDICKDTFNDILEAQTNKQRKRAYIERNREAGHNRLWNDYFTENPTYEAHFFRRSFRINKELFMRIVYGLSQNVPFFQQRRYAIGRLGLSPGTLNDINVLDRSPIFDDIIEGRAPRLEYVVNGHKYKFAYYLTDGIYPKWSTFIQSITLPQVPKANLFAKVQEAARKDVEQAFGALQARFAIVKNPALTWDKEKIAKIMRACIILHNMIVENERNGYARIDISEFEEGKSPEVHRWKPKPTGLQISITYLSIKIRKIFRIGVYMNN